jgi:hypothetical protein
VAIDLTAGPIPLTRGTVVIARQKHGLHVQETSRPECRGVLSKDGCRNTLDVLAHLLIDRTTTAEPSLADARRVCRAIVVIEVCEPPFVPAIGRAWVEQVAAAAGSRSCCNPIPVIIRPPVSSRTSPADDRDEDIREACRGEPHVLIVAHAGRPWPPAEVRTAADVVVRLPRVGPDMLDDIAMAVGGSRPTV